MNKTFRLLQEQNKETGRKLLLATGLMFTLPIFAFFLGRWYFGDKTEPDNWGGGCAILVTNIIVGVYCYSALTEPDDEDDNNDRSGPKVGAFKQRTD